MSSNTIREQILQAVGNLLATVASAHAGHYLREPHAPLTREQTPALVLLPELDAVIASNSTERTQRALTLRIVAVSRQAGTSGSAATLASDAMLASAHAALYSHQPLLNLVSRIEATDTDWNSDAFEVSASWQPARYVLTYLTKRNDIATKG